VLLNCNNEETEKRENSAPSWIVIENVMRGGQKTANRRKSRDRKHTKNGPTPPRGGGGGGRKNVPRVNLSPDETGFHADRDGTKPPRDGRRGSQKSSVMDRFGRHRAACLNRGARSSASSGLRVQFAPRKPPHPPTGQGKKHPCDRPMPLITLSEGAGRSPGLSALAKNFCFFFPEERI